MIVYEMACTSCKHRWDRYMETGEDRYSEAPCPLCGEPSRRVITMPRVAWHDAALKTGGFPSADDVMVKDRERRKQKELENVESHGTEFPNLKET